ncbi:MAG: TetR/AcrR family transcriptional regulator [Catenulisporales bacterium]|nr:TetR/AcrR family transcriptional regulator [Catenulisporales bacterium]
MSARRQELLHKTLLYAAEHSVSDLSLRPLAAAIGSSPRVLLYLFGSKENLLREVSAAERAQELELFQQSMAEGDSRTALERLWVWISDPDRAQLSRLFYENYVRSLDGAAGLEGAAEESVRTWLEPLAGLLGDEARARLALAVMRGLILDLLATGERARVDAAWETFLDATVPI